MTGPQTNDWLAEHHEDGQTYDDFLQSDRNSPDEIHNLIYLQPIGQLCLRKLQSSIRFDVTVRYHRLQQFYSNVGFNFEQDWVTVRLKKIEDSNYGQD